MTPLPRLILVAVAIATAIGVAVRADVPHIYAIKGARIVPVSGATIASGTMVIRNGVIDAVGADVSAPSDARVIEGSGLTVYPGLIDMGSGAAVDQTPSPPPANLRTTEEAERWKRAQIFRPDFDVAEQTRSDAPELARLANAGIKPSSRPRTVPSSRGAARSSMSPLRWTSRRSATSATIAAVSWS